MDIVLNRLEELSQMIRDIFLIFLFDQLDKALLGDFLHEMSDCAT
jgi:hypothetical protein